MKKTAITKRSSTVATRVEAQTTVERRDSEKRHAGARLAQAGQPSVCLEPATPRARSGFLAKAPQGGAAAVCNDSGV